MAAFLLAMLAVSGSSESPAPSLIALAAILIAFYVPAAVVRPSKRT